MSEHNKNVPKIRFPGFTDAWEQRRLSTISNSTYGGGTPKTGEAPFWGGNLPWVQTSDISEDILYVNGPKKTITESGLNNSAAKLVPANSIAVVTRVGVGKLAFMPYEYATSQDFLSLSDLNVDSWFGTYLLYKLLQKEKNAVQGTSIKGITKEGLLSMNIIIPTDREEQEEIGSFFKELDHLITLHQRKLNHLQDEKKGLLQKMFPKGGENFPELRFPGFTGAWEQRKAVSIFQTVSDKNHPELPVLSASQELGMIRRDQIGIDIKYDEKSTKTYKRVTPGQFVIHLRSFQGGFAHSNVEGITSPAYTVLDFKDKSRHDDKFWREVFTSSIFIKHLETVTYGIRDGRSISFTDFSTLKFYFPSFEEQKKIGEFFNQLDHLITLHQRKLEHLQDRKKALLQQMFI